MALPHQNAPENQLVLVGGSLARSHSTQLAVFMCADDGTAGASSMAQNRELYQDSNLNATTSRIPSFIMKALTGL